MKHGFADLDDLFDLLRGHLMMADANGGFDEGECEAFDSITENGNVVNLGFVVFFHDFLGVDPLL